MKKTLNKIEDFYVRRGYRGDKLRKVLQKDKDYSRLLRQRKRRIESGTKISRLEKRKYVLSTEDDIRILNKVHQAEKIKSLRKNDKLILKLIRSQLEHDWRKHLLRRLNKIIRKRN